MKRGAKEGQKREGMLERDDGKERRNGLQLTEEEFLSNIRTKATIAEP
jgi:hypothetical protein